MIEQPSNSLPLLTILSRTDLRSTCARRRLASWCRVKSSRPRASRSMLEEDTMAKTLTVVGRVASVGLLMTGLGGCPQVTVRARDAEADLPGADAEALVLAVPGAGARGGATKLLPGVGGGAARP